MANFKILRKGEIESELSKLNEWRVEDNYIKASFNFNSFKEAISLINMVALEAEAMNHHPLYTHNFKTVEFKFSTHDAGSKVTDLDIKMARYISTIYKKNF